MNNADRDTVRLEIREFFEHFLKETLPEILRQHEKTCMHGREVRRIKWLALGIMIGVGTIAPQLLGMLYEFFKGMVS